MTATARISSSVDRTWLGPDGSPVEDSGRGASGPLVVREMTEAEFEVRVRSFHDAPDELLATMGVDSKLLPDPDEWRSSYVRESARPLAERESFALSWLLEGTMIGFTTADRIQLGRQAFMHLHIVTAARRRNDCSVSRTR
jgi:hypothetical protein